MRRVIGIGWYSNPLNVLNIYEEFTWRGMVYDATEGLADVKVYETSSEGLADCLIYVTSSEGLASGDAKWYFVNSEGLADVKIYFTSSEGLADKKVYFTKSEGLAKCDVDWKGYKKSNAGYLARSLDALQFPTDALIRNMVLPDPVFFFITR